MNRSFVLGVLGFVIGGGIISLHEFRPDLIQNLMMDEGAEQTDASANTDDQPPATSVGDAKLVTAASSTTKQPRQDNSLPAARSTAPPPETSAEKGEALRKLLPGGPDETNSQDDLGAAANRPPQSDGRSRSQPAPRRQASRAVIRDPDTQRDFEVRIRRILVGADVAAAAVIDEPELRKHERGGRYVVYFDLSVTNQGKSAAPRISHDDFRLEDGKGMMYSPLKPRNSLSGRLEPAETARGGVAFAVYNDSAPARLLIRTGAETFQSLPPSVFLPGGE